MKYKKLTLLALFMALSFSVVHEYFFLNMDEDHCTVVEYAHEIDGSMQHGDVCDMHHLLHQFFVLETQAFFPAVKPLACTLPRFKSTQSLYTPPKLIKPPIA